jgi:hypothetical protein
MFRSPSWPAFVIVAACASLATVFVNVPVFAQKGGAADVAAKSDAQTDQPSPVTSTTAPADKGTAVSDDASDKAAAAALKQRAGEKNGTAPRGKALLLGMSLQESPTGHVKVVEVAAASPAYDAGVHEGDEILSYQGFSADSYRKWIDGMHRLTDESPADSRIAMVVQREGKRMSLAIRVPERAVRTPESKVLPQFGTAQSQVAEAVPTPVSPTAGGLAVGNDVLIGDTAPFGEFFGNQTDTTNDRAMAQIVRLNPAPQTTAPMPAPTPPGAVTPNPNKAAVNPNVGTNTAPVQGKARIGLAGFHDDPTGMVVMIDIGALPAGTYIVGISDPSVTPGLTRLVPPFDSKVATPPALPVAPQATAGGQTNTISNGATIPASGLAQPTTTPATAGPVATATTPAGQSTVNNAQQNQPAPTNTAVNPTNTVASTAKGVNGALLDNIGTLTIDQSGTGRMQQKVEGVKVRNVVGRAIVIYSQSKPQQTLPADLNGSAGAASREGIRDTVPAPGSQATTTAGQRNTTASTVAPNPPWGTRLPVAAGIIRLISDRRPPATGTQTTETPTGTNPAIEQPANAVPATGATNRVR